MKNQFKLLTLSAAAALLSVGCTTSDEVATTPSLAQSDAPTAVQFGTYMGKTSTRAGYEATSDMTTDLLKNIGATTDGFGVFAYYTGAKTYNEAQYMYSGSAVSAEDKIAPNFMYNQQVTWRTDKWIYTPVKYWPNEVQNGNVDEQTSPATSTEANGGKVSFFAYAPYVSVDQTTAANENGADPNSSAINNSNTTDGILKLSGNAYKGDPIISYTMPADINTGGAFVDLLWGTYNGTDAGVASLSNSGATGIADASGGTYEEALLTGKTTNADLTKQKVSGQVEFLFQHALAKIGGANDAFQIIADIDDGSAASGGSYEVVSSKKNTKVTLKSITIANATTKMKTAGKFNLATGQWTETTGEQTFSNTWSNIPSTKLNSAIIEPDAATVTGWKTSWTDTEYIKTDEARNVFANDQAPCFYIIPGEQPRLKVTVCYVVRTQDAALADGFTEVEQTISKEITFTRTAELNKRYNLKIHLGLTTVKFEATVANWDDNSGAGYLEEIHVPLNVTTP